MVRSNKMADRGSSSRDRSGRSGRRQHRLSMYIPAAMCVVFMLLLPGASTQPERLSLSQTEFHLLVDENKLFQLVQRGEFNTTVVVTLTAQHGEMIQLVPPRVELPPSTALYPDNTTLHTHDVCVLGKRPGHSNVTFKASPPGYLDVSHLIMRITVMYSREILTVSQVMGWVYFAAWSVSFYPQIYSNYARRSVVGLNFDFLALNLLGFTCYSLFNCGLYFSQLIQVVNGGVDCPELVARVPLHCTTSEYFARHPQGLNPVQLNDVFFSLHATCATLLTIGQCVAYERGSQRVSLAGRGVVGLLCAVVAVGAALAATGFTGVQWLDFLYYCSYVKLTITLIKYLPQAYMNYKRKSTVGWSIGNIFLDLVGGALSMLQMLLNAYNYHDWISIFTDITKFGLGLFSLLFDIFFILQHYVFYRVGREFVFVPGFDNDVKGSVKCGDRGAPTFYEWDNAEEKKPGADIKA